MRTDFYEYTIINGQMVPSGDARVSLFSSALLSSFGVYESVEVRDGVTFHLADHLQRLFNSADMIEMEIPNSREEITEWMLRLVRTNGYSTCLVRILALGSTNRHEEAMVCVLPYSLPRYPEEFYTEGAHVVTYRGRRPMPQCKSLNTLVNFLARREAERKGAHEGILVHDGSLTEGSRSNVFAVRGGEIITPPSKCVIAGITRDIVMRLAKEVGYPVREAPLLLEDVPGFDEMFVTSTSMHVVPVVRIDGAVIGDGHVGKMTTALHDRYEEYYRSYLEAGGG